VLTKLVLVLLYAVLIGVGLWRRLLGRDTLRLRRPTQCSTFWLVREVEPKRQPYFSESSVSEGRPTYYAGSEQRTDKGTAPRLTGLLLLLSRAHRPVRATKRGAARLARDRQNDIPDEIYTLW
jgi:hypothetical protein